MSYYSVAFFTQLASLALFALVFAAAIAYAFLPRNRSRFEEAARLPLGNEDIGNSRGKGARHGQ